MKINGKVAFITGGSRGIGAGIVEKFTLEGASVAFTYSGSKQKADELVAKHKGTLFAVQANVADEASVKSAIAKVVEKFGRIDIVVNNAGVGEFIPAQELTLEDYDRTMNVNVRGLVATIIHSIPHMKNGGKIINISSVHAERMPFGGGGVYAMSKFAVKGLTQGFARDLAALGINVNSIQPGPIDTDMNPADGPGAAGMHALMAIKKHGKPADIANLAAFLASDEANFITGTSMSVDGGFLA
jgi:3-oxoacyl-[acyl-carrier protein] reductase